MPDALRSLGRPTRSARGTDRHRGRLRAALDRKSTRLNSSHVSMSYAVFCLKKKKHQMYMILTYKASNLEREIWRYLPRALGWECRSYTCTSFEPCISAVAFHRGERLYAAYR